jgi:hypothetical protein
MSRNERETPTHQSIASEGSAASSFSIKKWAASADSSSLHLDDIQNPGQDIIAQSAVAFDQIPAGRATQRSPPLDVKRREHVRLFKEYIACCKGPQGRADSSPDLSTGASICDEDPADSCAEGHSAGTEYGSFLRPNRRAGFQARTMPRGGKGAGGRDPSPQLGVGGAASPDQPVVRPGILRSSTHLRAASGSSGSPSTCQCSPSSAPGSTGSQPSPDEARVYRSQVATALKQGRSVWL